MHHRKLDYHQFYDLEFYLLNIVRPRFVEQGHLSAFDFFCIIIWKANRAKSKIAKKLLDNGYKNLERAVRSLTRGLYRQSTDKDKLYYLCKDWQFSISMASAVLAILYPDDFTVYDIRVSEVLNDFRDVKNRTNFDNIWRRYREYKCKIEESISQYSTLRDKDRYLWGKSFYQQLSNDIENVFNLE